MLPDETFLAKLQEEARLQARLERERFFPRQLDGVTAFVGRYPWQTVAMLSLITAALLESVA